MAIAPLGIHINICRLPTEKMSEFLDHHLQTFMNYGGSYIQDTGGLMDKLKVAEEIPKR